MRRNIKNHLKTVYSTVKKKFNSSQRMQQRHNQICKNLATELKDRGWYDDVYTNIDYDLGECDVLAVSNSRKVYFEIKVNHTIKGYNKSKHQLLRYTSSRYYRSRPLRDGTFKGKKFDGKDFYGVYHTPTQPLEIICKNMYLRKGKK